MGATIAAVNFATNPPTVTVQDTSPRDWVSVRLARAVREYGAHVMITPPDGKWGYEASLSPSRARDGAPDMCHGEHPTDPLAALLIALDWFDREYPPMSGA